MMLLFHKKLIVLLVVLVAQSAALLVSGFVTPSSPFGLSGVSKSISCAGPLLVSAVEDESAEAVVEEPEAAAVLEEIPKVADAEQVSQESSDESKVDAAAAAAQKQRLTLFVGNLPFRK
jgi:hypothetical protein